MHPLIRFWTFPSSFPKVTIFHDSALYSHFHTKCFAERFRPVSLIRQFPPPIQALCSSRTIQLGSTLVSFPFDYRRANIRRRAWIRARSLEIRVIPRARVKSVPLLRRIRAYRSVMKLPDCELPGRRRRRRLRAGSSPNSSRVTRCVCHPS